MLSKKGFLFNADRCVGCKACVLACKNENLTGEGVWWRRVTEQGMRNYMSISCNHCDSPECFRVCPRRAYSKRQDGVVLIDSSRCDGCRTCVNACPYHAPQYDAVKRKVSKCNYCLDRQQKGSLPACVSACHTGALEAIDLEKDYLPGALTTISGFPDITLTNPSIRFYPVKEHERFWVEGADNSNRGLQS